LRIHPIDKNRLRVRHVSRKMKSKILTSPAGQQVIPRNYALHHQNRDIRFVALSNDVIVGAQSPGNELQRSDLGNVLFAKLGMLLELPNQDFMSIDGDFRAKRISDDVLHDAA
jgi:hypothetical protein